MCVYVIWVAISIWWQWKLVTTVAPSQKWYKNEPWQYSLDFDLVIHFFSGISTKKIGLLSSDLHFFFVITEISLFFLKGWRKAGVTWVGQVCKRCYIFFKWSTSWFELDGVHSAMRMWKIFFRDFDSLKGTWWANKQIFTAHFIFTKKLGACHRQHDPNSPNQSKYALVGEKWDMYRMLLAVECFQSKSSRISLPLSQENVECWFF